MYGGIGNTKDKLRQRITAALMVPLALGLADSCAAQSNGGEFEVTRSSVDAGGGYSQAAEFTLTGTIAQPDGSTQVASGGEFQMTGGFWAGSSTALTDELFSNGFEGS